MTLPVPVAASTLTTAQMLGALRRELVDQGIDGELRDDLVRQAMHWLLQDVGLGVKTPEATA